MIFTPYIMFTMLTISDCGCSTYVAEIHAMFWVSACHSINYMPI